MQKIGFRSSGTTAKLTIERGLDVSAGVAALGRIPCTHWVWARSMDRQTFDRLTLAIATGQNRRAFVRWCFGIGAATAVAGHLNDRALAAPVQSDNASTPPVRLQQPGEPRIPVASPANPTAPTQNEMCIEPLIAAVCGCLDPNSQVCCEEAVCTGVCTMADGCCALSNDQSMIERGEICGDHCCHPHLDPTHADYSECCDGNCCAGHCYGEDLCCPVDRFCPGLSSDRCCTEDERCCGAGTTGNSCIPNGNDSCCGIDECVAAAGACYVSCDAGFCRQHICNDGAICCPDSAGGVGCIVGNCCSDTDCAAGEICQNSSCTATVECMTDTDCTAEGACSMGTCQDGSCQYAPRCPGECATCLDGICSTDTTLCGLCGACDAGVCTPVVCPDGYSCYAATGECLGIA